MKLQQLRYLHEIVRNDLNVTQTAQNLYTSQPGISKQIRQLEDELGVEIFARNGKHFSRITPAGDAILKEVREILLRVSTIRTIAQEFSDDRCGSLSIATTHTQSRYVLPPVIQRFISKFPKVALQLHQGTPLQIAELAAEGTADFAIATEAMELFSDLVMLPCYQWNRAIIFPINHPLAQHSSITLEEVSRHPIVTYTFGFTGRSRLDEAFQAQDLQPRVVFTAADADVIKTYVRLGLGIGIVAKMAWDPVMDQDLVALDASHLFAPSITKIGLRRTAYMRGFMYDFIEMFAPHLSRELVDAALSAVGPGEVDRLFQSVELPEH
jgi:LysR family cys regulon transcriptional activator